MGTVKVHYDRAGNTLTVYFDDPRKEHLCDNIDDELVLIKDRRGRVIGFERFNYLPKSGRGRSAKIPIEVEAV
jgi:uncharacterized protein YuzE